MWHKDTVSCEGNLGHLSLDEICLGWCYRQSSILSTNYLPKCLSKFLENWSFRWYFEEGFSLLCTLCDLKGHLKVPPTDWKLWSFRGANSETNWGRSFRILRHVCRYLRSLILTFAAASDIFILSPLPRMKCKALQGFSRLWADIGTTTRAHRLCPQKAPNPWTENCRLGPLQIREVWNIWVSLVSLCVVCNFPSSKFLPVT